MKKHNLVEKRRGQSSENCTQSSRAKSESKRKSQKPRVILQKGHLQGNNEKEEEGLEKWRSTTPTHPRVNEEISLDNVPHIMPSTGTRIA